MSKSKRLDVPGDLNVSVPNATDNMFHSASSFATEMPKHEGRHGESGTIGGAPSTQSHAARAMVEETVAPAKVKFGQPGKQDLRSEYEDLPEVVPSSGGNEHQSTTHDDAAEARLSRPSPRTLKPVCAPGSNTDSTKIPTQPNSTPSYHEMPAMNRDRLGLHPTVTPLYLLGDQSDYIDCPFCQHRTETVVKRPSSATTQYVLCCHLSWEQTANVGLV